MYHWHFLRFSNRLLFVSCDRPLAAPWAWRWGWSERRPDCQGEPLWGHVGVMLVSPRYSVFVTLQTSRGLWWWRALWVKNLDFILNVIWNQSKFLCSRVAWSDLLFQKITLAAVWKMDWEGTWAKQCSPSQTTTVCGAGADSGLDEVVAVKKDEAGTWQLCFTGRASRACRRIAWGGWG